MILAHSSLDGYSLAYDNRRLIWILRLRAGLGRTVLDNEEYFENAHG